ncbi:hypothetical protein BKI51_06035 [Alphaproteobacteria bacterium AO1-B]|nr:hypothetical protein BKI51_06035 [Alphaproteobacteria bacterium AO1-B]
MLKFVHRPLIRALKFAGFTVVGGIVAIIAVAIFYLNSLSDLEPWHTVHLDEDYSANGAVSSFTDYLAMEDRLFAELQDELISKLSFGPKDEVNRFQPDSVSNPQTWPRNWNRSFLFETESPTASVLLLHGMSDSPYSLREIGRSLHEAGANVLGLRLPGHGTAPAGLLETKAEDMISATALAADHLKAMQPDKPLFAVGYSNGGALSVVHALRQLEDPSLAKIDRIILLSPAIGVTPAAAYAPIAIQLGHILGVQRLAWSSLGPEYDPYKYTSFAINAGYVTHQLTMEIRSRMDAATADGSVAALPPILGFSSAVDATVITRDMISNLYAKLPENGSELLLFDTNQFLTKRPLLSDDAADFLDPLVTDAARTYTLRVITNETPSDRKTVLNTYVPGTNEPAVQRLDLSWPRGVFSLAHISLPFSAEDPLYGIIPQPEISRLQLGALALRGERGISEIPAGDMLRMRWNPFHSIMLSETQSFLDPTLQRRD